MAGEAALSTVADMMKYAGYATKAMKLYNLINGIVAASQAGTLAPTIATQGALLMMSAFPMAASYIDQAEEKNKWNIMKGRIKHTQEAGKTMQSVAGEGRPQNIGQLRNMLEKDSGYQGARVGDILADMADKNLTWAKQGQYASGHNAVINWLPNYKLEPLAEGLKRMGYDAGKVDTTGLLTYGGGFKGTESRTLRYADTENSVANWEKILSGYASLFPQDLKYGPTVPQEEVNNRRIDATFGTPGELGAYLAGDPYYQTRSADADKLAQWAVQNRWGGQDIGQAYEDWKRSYYSDMEQNRRGYSGDSSGSA